jgi:chromate reductase, NAD(P)H dehydrogenase (quinone)
MNTITVISGTNRPNSYTRLVAQQYANMLTNSGVEVKLLSLEQLPNDFIASDLYGNRSETMELIISEFINNVNKFVFVVPEYNGSYPGIVKLFLDSIPPRMWNSKKASIVGVSTGQAGNLRGQEHLTGVLNYLKVNVHFNKPKLSLVDRLFNEDKETLNEETRKRLVESMNQLIEF